MKRPEIGIEDIPAPGEPLTPKVHEVNQALIDSDIAERAERARSRLSKRQIRQMNRRYDRLYKMLKRGRWNELVLIHWEARQTVVRLQHEAKQATGAKRRQLVGQYNAARVALQAAAAAKKPLQSAADEFQSIKNRFEAHNKVLEWEKEEAENRAQFRREARVWEEQIKSVFRQSGRLHHVGEDSKGRSFITIPKIENIIFKDDRVLYQIATSKQSLFGRLFGRWYSTLPYNVDIKDLTCEETLQNLTAATRRVVSVIGEGTNIFYSISRLDSPDGIPNKMLYSKCIDWYPVEMHSKTPWIMGVGESRKVEFADFETYPHILLAGSTKGGKSNHLNQMIATMTTMSTPAELGLLLIDLKGGIEFTHWAGLKHQIRPMVKSQGEVLEALQFMRSIMERRLIMFRDMKAKNLETYNEKARDKLPRLITVVDEMATLIGLGDLTTAIHDQLRIISSQGRAVGLHLVLCTQHSSVDIIPGWVKTNMGIRASTSMPTHVASEVILGTGTAAKIPKIPGRVVFSMGRDEVIVQSPYISDAEIARAVELSNQFADPDRSEMLQSIKEPVRPPAEKFSKDELFEIVLTHFEGKISATGIYKHLGGKENDVATERELKRMVAGIIEIGLQKGIEYGGQQYRLKKVSGRGNYTMILVTGQASGQESLPEISDENTSTLPTHPQDEEMELAS